MNHGDTEARRGKEEIGRRGEGGPKTNENLWQSKGEEEMKLGWQRVEMGREAC